jgi:hypothetical protein
MATDRQLSRDFWLREFSGWQDATELEVGRLHETVARVLQPVRDRWGPVIPTSWLRWSDGSRRTGAHGVGGTVDFVTPSSPMRDVWEWGRVEILPAGYVGRWIYEPTFPGEQREHIHVAPRDDMAAAYGRFDVGAYEETSPGVYVLVGGPGPSGGGGGGGSGAYGDPYVLPGLTATVGHRWWPLALAALILALAGRRALS